MPLKDAVGIFKALADPARLRIMLLLRRRELCVCELMYVLEMEQSRVSHHMRILRDAGLAEDIRMGRWIIYRVPEEAAPLLEDLLAGALKDSLTPSAEAKTDLRKLAACVRENVRGRVCEARPRKGKR
jgi:ArsR family transcriptional regulator, arsenate/arsenite/antimonite-responsive transcriptional repressor